MFRKILFTALLLSCTLTPIASRGGENTLSVGAASVKINPQAPVRMAGYAARWDRSTDVHLDLFVRAIVLDSGDKQLVWVVADVCGIDDELAEQIRSKICEQHKLKPDQLILSATHTHFGAKICGDTPDREKPEIDYTNNLFIPSVYKAVDKAMSNRQPCQVCTAEGICPLAHDRRNTPIAGDGKAKDADAKLAYVDNRVPAVAFKRADGSYKSILMLYGMHPTSGFTTTICAQWPGAACAAIQKKFGPDVEPFVLQGAGGNLGGPQRRAPLDVLMSWGDRLVDSFADQLKKSIPCQGTAFDFRVESCEIPFELMTPDEVRAEAAKRREELAKNNVFRGKVDRWEKNLLQQLKDNTTGPLRFKSTLVALGDRVFVTTPTETFSHVNREIARHTKAHVYAVGYTNGYMGYWPATEVMRQEGYEGGSSAVWSGRFRYAQGSLEAFAAKVAPLAQDLVRSNKLPE